MLFIGQDHIRRQLEDIIPELQSGRNLNFILRAPSGWGKTKLAILIASKVAPNDIQYELPDENGDVILENKRVIIIDEAHTLKQPEMLYPVMDSQKHIFIFCSNEWGELKEPLVNRCIDLNFDEYEPEELGAIILQDFKTNGIEITTECIIFIVNNCNNNPRIARQLAERLTIIYKHRGGIISNLEDLKDIMLNVLQLDNGLNPLHKRYLEFLSKVKTASLDLISNATRLDKRTIKGDIEPILLHRNLITISSKGRTYNG
jgi:Holliday junction resolvasome RuvABC ATP-dependent DNA helicase subunit